MTERRSKQSKQSLPSIIDVDTFVVGAGLGGLLAASQRARAGKRVFVAEAAERAGGRWSPVERDGFLLGAGLNLANAETWAEAHALAGLDLDSVPVERGAALSFASNSWEEPEDLEAWESYFTQPIAQVPRGGQTKFIEKLLASGAFQIAFEAPVVELHIEGGKATHAVLGNGTQVRFEECIWASSAKELMDTLRGADAPPSGTPRIAWLKQFVATATTPGVVLEFAHQGPVSEFTETLLLPLPTPEKEEQRYLVGAFVSNRDSSLAPEGAQLSSWTFSLPSELYEDNNEISKRIRAARRALEKAFPGFEKSILFERVQVLPHTVTPPKKKRAALPGQPFSNLIPASDWASPSGGQLESAIERLL